MIVDFDKDRLISLKVYWLDKIILSSYPLVSVSLVVFQAIIAFLRKGPMFRPLLKILQSPNDNLLQLHQNLFGLQIKSSAEQLTKCNFNTFFISLICQGIMRELRWPGQESAEGLIFKLHVRLWKWDTMHENGCNS